MRARALKALLAVTALVWSLAVFRLLAHLIPVNQEDPAVGALLAATAPLAGHLRWQASDFALYQEGILPSLAAVVILSVLGVVAASLLGIGNLDSRRG